MGIHLSKIMDFWKNTSGFALWSPQQPPQASIKPWKCAEMINLMIRHKDGVQVAFALDISAFEHDDEETRTCNFHKRDKETDRLDSGPHFDWSAQSTQWHIHVLKIGNRKDRCFYCCAWFNFSRRSNNSWLPGISDIDSP